MRSFIVAALAAVASADYYYGGAPGPYGDFYAGHPAYGPYAAPVAPIPDHPAVAPAKFVTPGYGTDVVQTAPDLYDTSVVAKPIAHEDFREAVHSEDTRYVRHRGVHHSVDVDHYAYAPLDVEAHAYMPASYHHSKVVYPHDTVRYDESHYSTHEVPVLPVHHKVVTH